MTSRRVRLNLWRATVTVLLLVAAATVWVWSRGEMIDHGLWRTLAWTGLGIVALAFLYPRRER